MEYLLENYQGSGISLLNEHEVKFWFERYGVDIWVEGCQEPL